MITTSTNPRLLGAERDMRAKHLLAHARLLTGKGLGIFYEGCADPERRGTDRGYLLAKRGWARVIVRSVQQPEQKNPNLTWLSGEPTPPETLSSATPVQQRAIREARTMTCEQISTHACERWLYLQPKKIPIFEATQKLRNLFGLPRPGPLIADQIDHDLVTSDSLVFYHREYGWDLVKQFRGEHCYKNRFPSGQKVVDAVFVRDERVMITPETIRDNTVIAVESLGRYSPYRVWSFVDYWLEGGRLNAVHLW